jgi:hypothetical protein
MSAPQEFHYRLQHRIGGQRPGSHPGSSLGAGQEFVSHMSLYDRPDPRRLDLRASLRDFGGNWLVRVNRQRAGVPVHVIVDVSASMSFGSRKTNLFMPALRGRGTGSVMAAMLRQCETTAGGVEGLEAVAAHFAGRRGLIFLLSDFHWPIEKLDPVLDFFAHAYLVPMIVWDPAEIEPPAKDALTAFRDAESGARRTLWLRPKLRDQWRDAVAQRRMALDQLFAARAIRPFYTGGAFDGEAMSRYFFEAAV